MMTHQIALLTILSSLGRCTQRLSPEQRDTYGPRFWITRIEQLLWRVRQWPVGLECGSLPRMGHGSYPVKRSWKSLRSQPTRYMGNRDLHVGGNSCLRLSRIFLIYPNPLFSMARKPSTLFVLRKPRVWFVCWMAPAPTTHLDTADFLYCMKHRHPDSLILYRYSTYRFSVHHRFSLYVRHLE